MGRTIAHRELRNNSSAILREVQEGETFTITNNGKAVAILSPVTEDMPALRVRAARSSGGFRHLERLQLDHPIQETLDELRGDR